MSPRLILPPLDGTHARPNTLLTFDVCELVIYKAKPRAAATNIPAPRAPTFFEAAPVYGEGVADVPRAFDPDGRIGEPVADDPGPEPKGPAGPSEPPEVALPVGLTSPLVPMTLVELNCSVNIGPQSGLFQIYLMVDVFVQEHSLSKYVEV